METLTKEQEIDYIEGRIIDEHRKHSFHSPDEWARFAASKIHSQWKEYWTADRDKRILELEKEMYDAKRKLLNKTTENIENLRKLNQTKVYLFKFNDCIYESSWATISIHKTKEGAEKALNEHKEKDKEEFDKLYKDSEEPSEYTHDHGKDWRIGESEILI